MYKYNVVKINVVRANKSEQNKMQIYNIKKKFKYLSFIKFFEINVLF